ncbi:MAG: prephenate dehydrogenase/arogenate dehydrogenase family protein [Oscillospiraceae bacterium]|nr:prephenate dehydrogenase/arogenate dehydrogenase family protein [Oscillospiraceae bacterium]
MQIGIVGLGLIGGSMAKAVKERTTHTVLGADQDRAVLTDALAQGAIDGVLEADGLKRCQIVLVALYPQAAVDYILSHQTDFERRTIVVDCCGVKEVVCTPCGAAAKKSGFTFIGGHPMAGIERSGFAFSSGDLFAGASMILTPPEGTDPAAVNAVFALCKELGFGRVQLSTPQEHDRMIALTSQLAHVLSSAYVKSPAALAHAGFSAGSFKDMTRVARLNENMWTELFFDNKPALLDEIEGLIGRLEEYAEALRQNDREGMRGLLRAGRERKEIVG